MDQIMRLVEIAATALEEEDKLILGATRPTAGIYPEPVCGLLRNGMNEHHYQYIMGRALMRSFPYVVQFEAQNRYDLLIRYPGSAMRDPFAVVEIKTYFKENEREKKGIRSDIEHKLLKCRADYALMLIISFSVGGQRMSQSDWTSLRKERRLSLYKASRTYYHAFPTFESNGQECTVWIATSVLKSP